jgi:hypothetical protein
MKGTLLIATVIQTITSAPPDSGTASVLTGAGSVISAILLSIIASGVLTAVWTTQAQRIKDLREYWLKASDEFLTAVTSGFKALKKLEPRQDEPSRGLRRAWRRNRLDELELSVGKDWERAIGDKVAESAERLRRIQLLFGPKSPMAQAGSGCVEQLETAWFAMCAYYMTVREIEGRQAVRQENLSRLISRLVASQQVASQQVASQQVAPGGARRKGIEWLRDMGAQYAKWLLGRWRQGIGRHRWSQVEPPHAEPPQVSSESQESKSRDSVIQKISDVLVAGLPLMQYRSNLTQLFQSYQGQGSVKDIQKKAKSDYQNSMGEVDRNLNSFVALVYTEVDNLRLFHFHLPRWLLYKRVFTVDSNETVRVSVRPRVWSRWLLRNSRTLE